MQPLGDILEVDLTTRSVVRRTIDESVVRRVLLGRGFNSLALLQDMGAEVEPLDAANPLLFTCGLLTGTQAPSAARVQVSARSPLTGLLGSSSVGGTVGPALKANGVQSLCVTGRAETPSYLLIADGRVEVRDASHLWGLDVAQATQAVEDELTEKGLVMFLIGPAGEHLLPLACIVTQRGHAAGRTGMGAVMGSKNLKAVVVKGAKDTAGADEEARAAVKRYLAKIKAAPNYADKAAHGTSSAVNPVNEMGMLGSYNYQKPRFEGAAAIDGTSMDRHVERLRACRRCPVHCKAELRLASGPYAGLEGERPDFEPIVSWGSKSGLADPEAIIYLHHLCDLFGIDSVSAGNAVAFAMQLWEEGIVTAEDTGGLELEWGDATVMETLVRQMAAGEGFGALLGRGVREAARIIGRGAEKYAYHVKGLELTAFDPRGASATGLGYAVSNRGGDFTSVYARHEFSLTPEQAKDLYGEELAADRTSPVGKAQMVKRSMVICAVLDSIGLCKIPALTLVNEFDLVCEAELVSAVAGLTVTPAELFEIGERIIDIERLLNIRFGAGVEDDVLPDFFLDEPMSEGPAVGHTVDLVRMLGEFYAVMGWTADGVPGGDALWRLGLEEFA
ncbi:MAG: aldehyde ferredoxin oxidoreductase family protein [Thermoleophilia bacterium]